MAGVRVRLRVSVYDVTHLPVANMSKTQRVLSRRGLNNTKR
jgi:hypothetical protein